MMKKRTLVQVGVLEKIAAPLMAFVIEATTSGKLVAPEDRNNLRFEAEKIAALLGRSVQLSADLAGRMELRETDETSDGLRLSVLALSSSLLAGQFRASGKIPGEHEVVRVVTALEAVLTFSDNFVASDEAVMRLAQLVPGGQAVDDVQASLQMVNILVPVVNTIAAFSFGRPEKKLVQEVSARLVQKAQELRSRFGSGKPEASNSVEELMILSGLVDVYIQCHQAETEKLMEMKEGERNRLAQAGGKFSMESVWEGFEVRVCMLEALWTGVAAVAGRNDAAARSPQTVSVPSAPQETSSDAALKKPQIFSMQAPQSKQPEQAQAAPQIFEPAETKAGGDSAVSAAESASVNGADAKSPMAFFKPGAKAPVIEGGADQQEQNGTDG